jgi:hypothetical protein
MNELDRTGRKIVDSLQRQGRISEIRVITSCE